MNAIQDIEAQIVEILIPYTYTQESRKSLMVASWGMHDRLIGDIALDGSPRQFAQRLVQHSAATGRRQGQYPVEPVLTYISQLVGADRQREIDSIIARLRDGLYDFDPLTARHANEPDLVQLPGDLPLFISPNPIQGEAYASFLEANKQQPAPSFEAGWSGRSLRESHEGTSASGVNYADAAAYCAWLNMISGRSYRLPSMAELRIAFQENLLHSDRAQAEWTATPVGKSEECIEFPKAASRHMLCKGIEEIEGRKELQFFPFLTRLANPVFTFRVILDLR